MFVPLNGFSLSCMLSSKFLLVIYFDRRCFLIGVLVVVAERTNHLSPHAQHVLVVGLLGSLTTFSTFALHSLNLLQHGRVGAAIVNVAMNVMMGISLTWLGMLAASITAGVQKSSPWLAAIIIPDVMGIFLVRLKTTMLEKIA